MTASTSSPPRPAARSAPASRSPRDASDGSFALPATKGRLQLEVPGSFAPRG